MERMKKPSQAPLTIVMPQNIAINPIIYIIGQLTCIARNAYEVQYPYSYYLTLWDLTTSNYRAFVSYCELCGFTRQMSYKYLKMLKDYTDTLPQQTVEYNETSLFTTLDTKAAIYYLDRLVEISESSMNLNTLARVFFYFYYWCKVFHGTTHYRKGEIVFGFSRSIDKICADLQSTKKTIIKTIHTLVDNNLIIIVNKHYRFGMEENNYGRVYQLAEIPREELENY